jgi:hypothetical protein
MLPRAIGTLLRFAAWKVRLVSCGVRYKISEPTIMLRNGSSGAVEMFSV